MVISCGSIAEPTPEPRGKAELSQSHRPKLELWWFRLVRRVVVLDAGCLDPVVGRFADGRSSWDLNVEWQRRSLIDEL